MSAREWVEQSERCRDNGKREFARQRLIDALERMTDDQVNRLCEDIMHADPGSAADTRRIAGEAERTSSLQ